MTLFLVLGGDTLCSKAGSSNSKQPASSKYAQNGGKNRNTKQEINIRGWERVPQVVDPGFKTH